MNRILECFICAVLVIVLFPVLVILGIIVRVKLGSPVLFTQERPGLNGKIFKLRKFRSMTDGVDKEGNLLSDEKRLTSFGKWLRRTSLDELPELFNILKGDMSFVGPRPLLVEYLDYYTPVQANRHKVRPGLTGWAQVNGRNSLSWPEKFDLDVWYVENRSLWLDLKIILMTIKTVFSSGDVNQEGHVTMQKFSSEDNRGI